MLLSDILNEMKFQKKYVILSECDFEGLALTASDVDFNTCVFLDNEKYLNDVKQNVCMICATEAVAEKLKMAGWNKGICVTENPRMLFFEVHNFLAENEAYPYCRKRFETKIGQNCKIDETASISKNNVIIGNDVIIEEFVVIRENTVIGDHSIIRAGSKIGGVGFEFKRDGDVILSVAHAGGVNIGEHVEIQYNACIDRAVYPWDNTVIGNYVKIDNLVHIAHGVKVEDNVMLVAQCGVGGRTVIGEKSWIGFSATVSNGLHIGKNARVNIGSVATKDVPDDYSVTGNFAIEHGKFIKNLKKMNEMES